MSALLPRGAGSVMAGRHEPPDSLDFFPTPPWATRALLPFLRDLEADAERDLATQTVWEPACGEGHMADVLGEAFFRVHASDVFEYQGWDRLETVQVFPPVLLDFLDEEALALRTADWIITNPPFKTAMQFALRALSVARIGVALLVRTSWLEGGKRYADLFSQYAPALVLQYCERVPMTKGRWDPAASTATSYCWVVWRVREGGVTNFAWIPPGQRTALTHPTDAARFGVKPRDGLFASDGSEAA